MELTHLVRVRMVHGRIHVLAEVEERVARIPVAHASQKRCRRMWNWAPDVVRPASKRAEVSFMFEVKYECAKEGEEKRKKAVGGLFFFSLLLLLIPDVRLIK